MLVTRLHHVKAVREWHDLRVLGNIKTKFKVKVFCFGVSFENKKRVTITTNTNPAESKIYITGFINAAEEEEDQESVKE